MISNSREKDLHAKQEGDVNEGKVPKAPSSSRQWSAFRNPRIVRVSRTFGGKDRHSKVCTVRGLRDRRIRLSVPTAIQLYDLQDRLGLNQPSKVIDWLLDATKNDIDKLPPLQVPQGFGQFHPPMILSNESTLSQPSISSLFDSNSAILRDGGFQSFGIKIANGLDVEDNTSIIARSKLWEMESSLSLKSKEAESSAERGKWVRTIEDDNQEEMSSYSSHMSAQKLFPLSNCHSSLPAGLLSNPPAFNSVYHLDASNLSLAQMGNQAFLAQPETSIVNTAIPFQSSLSTNPSGPQLVFCPQPTALPSFLSSYPQFLTASSMENDSREVNHLHLITSNHAHNVIQNPRPSSFPVRSFSLSVNPGINHCSKQP